MKYLQVCLTEKGYHCFDFSGILEQYFAILENSPLQGDCLWNRIQTLQDSRKDMEITVE